MSDKSEKTRQKLMDSMRRTKAGSDHSETKKNVVTGNKTTASTSTASTSTANKTAVSRKRSSATSIHTAQLSAGVPGYSSRDFSVSIEPYQARGRVWPD